MNALLGRIAGRLLGGRAASPARARAATEHFDAGLVQHRAGRVREALASYRRALAHDPDHFDALHMAGVAHQQLGATAEAIAHLERATALVPHDPAGHNNLGVAYLGAGRHDDAEASLRKAIALKPEWDQPHNNLGSVMRAAGRLDDAQLAFASAVRLNRDNHGALSNLANLCKERGQLDRAEQAFRQWLALDPATAEGWTGLADVLVAGERLDEALACYRKGLEIAPGARVFNGIGVLQQKRGDWAEALTWFRLAASADANSFEAARNLALALERTGDAEAARLEIERALELRPGDPDALAAAAAIRLALGDADAAQACCRQALERAPGHVEAHLQLGIVARARGDDDAAERAYRGALALQPDCAAASYNLGMIALARQDYAQGFALFESRFAAVKGTAWDLPQHRRRLADPRRWQGEDLAGRRLLVWGEQGFGDVIMALRYLPLLAARGAGEVVVQCEAALVRLARGVDGVAEAVADGVVVPAQRYDLHTPIMSLPRLFATRLDTIPRRVPYLCVPDELVRRFAAHVAKAPAAKVGLVWTTGSQIAEHVRRNVPLRALAPILDACGTVVSLQKGPAAADAAAFAGRIVACMDACEDFLDTAALIRNLDLVVSVDTAVAHLAGALGVPVFLFNRYRGDWRWGPQGEDAAWYPTMRIFAQRAPGDWEPAIRRVAAEVEAFRRGAQRPAA